MGGKGSGRIPRPAPLKLLNGRGEGRDSGGRKVNLGPRFQRQAPEPPEDLTDIERARWTQVIDDLEPHGLLKESDAGVLRLYVDAWTEYDTAKALLARTGPLIKNPKTGVVRRNPLVGVVGELRRDLIRIGAELGLSPVAVQRLQATDDAPRSDDNPFAWSAGAS